jgi:hypothetical protein
MVKGLVRHRDRLKPDFDDRVHQLHRLVDLGFPEFTRYVRALRQAARDHDPRRRGPGAQGRLDSVRPD